MTSTSGAVHADEVVERLIGWFTREGADLPWRRVRDRWPVLVSEAMLQATQVARVVPYYERFMARWPAPADMARAPLGEVLAEWQGLGYPRAGAEPARRRGGRGGARLAERPDGPAGRGRVHGGGDPVLRRRGGRAAARHQRRAGGRPPLRRRLARRVRPRVGGRPGGDGPRPAVVHRPRAALRPGVPAARGLRGGRRGARRRADPRSAAAGPLRGVDAPAPRRCCSARWPPTGWADPGRDPEAAASLVAEGLAAERGGRLVRMGA